MPFNELKRRDSFPPTIVHLTPPANDDKPLPSLPDPLAIQEEDIDENPISFFLTSPPEEFLSLDDEIDFFPENDDLYADVFDDDEDLSAGIEGSEEDLRSKEIPVREVSPSSLQRQREREKLATTTEEQEVEFGFAMPLSLKEWTARPVAAIDITPPTSGRVSRAGQRPGPTVDEQLKGLGIELPDFRPRTSSLHGNLAKEKERGRGRVRLTPTMDGRRSVSWSPNLNRRKPVSWRVPSRGIWRIDEVEEGDNWFDGLSSSAPTANSGFGIMKQQKDARAEAGKKKVVKRVHWADE